MAEVTRSLYKVHKSYECVTDEDRYCIKHIVIDTTKNNYQSSSATISDEMQIDEEEIATDIIQKAQCEAEEIILRAKQEANAMIEKIKQDAYEIGYNEGKKQGVQDVDANIEQAKDILNAMMQEKYNLITDLEPELVGLSIKIAEKIIGEQLNIDDTKYLSFISNAVKKASGSEISIFVHPKQFEKISELKQTLISQSHQIKSLSIFKKEVLDEFDCLIETDNGTIDAGVVTQIQKIEQAFELKESCV